MNYCGPAGTCGKRPDCADHHCPGRNEALFTQEEDDEPPWSLSDVEPGFWVVIGVSLLGIAYGLSEVVRLVVAGWK